MSVPTIDRAPNPTSPAYWDAIRAEVREQTRLARLHQCRRCGIDTTRRGDYCRDCDE